MTKLTVSPSVMLICPSTAAMPTSNSPNIIRPTPRCSTTIPARLLNMKWQPNNMTSPTAVHWISSQVIRSDGQSVNSFNWLAV